MDGGIDALYMDYFGAEIQLRVRRQIFDHHAGELLVGIADTVETGDTVIPFLIAAPTMRLPMSLSDSVNAYLAARSCQSDEAALDRQRRRRTEAGESPSGEVRDPAQAGRAGGLLRIA